MNAVQSNKKKGLIWLRGLSLILVVTVIGVTGVYISLPKNAAQFHKRNSKKAQNAAIYTKKLADQIGLSSVAVVSQGVDKGCEVESKHELLGISNHADCNYEHHVYFIGTSSKQNDIKTVYDHIKKSSEWDISGSSDVRYETFKSDPTYQAFPLYYSHKDSYGPNIEIVLFDSSNDPSRYLFDNFRATVAKKYLTKSNYIYGFSNNSVYYSSDCFKNICQTSKK